MIQYIDKSALVAWIKRRMDENRGKQTLPQYFGMVEEDLNILSFLDTLEVKEEATTDAFVKKACDFIRKMVDVPHNIDWKDGQPLVDDYIKYAEERIKAAEKVVEDFKKYMEGE